MSTKGLPKYAGSSEGIGTPSSAAVAIHASLIAFHIGSPETWPMPWQIAGTPARLAAMPAPGLSISR